MADQSKETEKQSKSYISQITKDSPEKKKAFTKQAGYTEASVPESLEGRGDLRGDKELQELGSVLQDLRTQRDTNVQNICELNQQLTVERDQVTKLTKEVDKLRNERKMYLRNIDGLKQQVQYKTLEIESLKKEQTCVKELEAKMQKQERTYKGLEKNLKSDLKQKDGVFVKLQKDTLDLQRMTKDAQQSYHEALGRIRELEEYTKTTGKLILENEQLKKNIQQEHNKALRTQDTVWELRDENQKPKESPYQDGSGNVSSDENVSLRNRPMTLKTEYEKILPNEWLDAKNALDDLEVEEDYSRMFLCDILLTLEKHAAMHYSEIMDKLKLFLCQPLVQDLGVPHSERDVTMQNSGAWGEESDAAMDGKSKLGKRTFPQDVTNVLEDYLRIHADTTDVSLIVESVKTDLCSGSGSKPWYTNALSSESVQRYMSVCAQLTWKMATQRPRMTFCVEGVYANFDEKSQEAMFGSDDPLDKQAVVMYYVMPTLCYADSIVVKGTVMIKTLK